MGPLVGLVRRRAHATLPFLNVVVPTRSIASPLRRKAASGDLSGRDFGAGQEFLGCGVDNEMALRDVFDDPREHAFAQHESAPCV